MVKILEKNLFVNGAEVFRIEIYPEEDIYYISDETALIKTTKEKFIEELEKCNWILKSKQSDLILDYNDLYLWAILEG